MQDQEKNKIPSTCSSFTGSRVTGIEINVCANGQSCFDCGTTSVTDPGVWVKFQCPSGTEGNTVHVKNDLYYLQICEIIVYSKCEYTCSGRSNFLSHEKCNIK